MKYLGITTVGRWKIIRDTLNLGTEPIFIFGQTPVRRGVCFGDFLCHYAIPTVISDRKAHPDSNMSLKLTRVSLIVAESNACLAP